MSRRSKHRLMNDINVVPYIDVMLVLLIIFMVTAPMINHGQIELPQIGKSLATPVMPLKSLSRQMETFFYVIELKLLSNKS